MKERLKMIFDRIDIFVVCIILGSCLCIAEAFLGIWNVFADSFAITLLATGICYTLRCNEKLEIELIETKEKLKKAESELVKVNMKLTYTEKEESEISDKIVEVDKELNELYN